MRDKYYNYFVSFFFIIAFFLGLYRFYPYLFSDIPLGYDPGMYRRMFLEYFNNLPYVDFSTLSEWNRSTFPPFLGILSNILILIGYKVDFLITFGLAFFSFITSIYIYIYLKKYSRITAINGMIIYFISIIQYESFFFNYYKQIIGILFLLISLYLLEKKKYVLSVPIIISMFTVNRPAGVFFLLVIIFYFIVTFIKGIAKRVGIFTFRFKEIHIFYTVLFSGIVSLLMYLPLFDELIGGMIKPLTTTFLVNGSSGTFFSLDDFIYYNFPVILLSFYGLYVKISKKDFDFITIGYIAGLLWIVFRLFFFSRFLIFFDLFIILIASYGLGELYKNKKRIYCIIFILFFSIHSYNYSNYLYQYAKPLIPKNEFETIKKLDTILPKNSLLMTMDKHYSPWLFGYTDLQIIGPVLINNNLWEKSDWDKWWDNDGKVKCEMIKDYEIYNKPIYIWIGKENNDENFNGGDCFKTIYNDGVSKIFKVKF